MRLELRQALMQPNAHGARRRIGVGDLPDLAGETGGTISHQTFVLFRHSLHNFFDYGEEPKVIS